MGEVEVTARGLIIFRGSHHSHLLLRPKQTDVTPDMGTVSRRGPVEWWRFTEVGVGRARTLLLWFQQPEGEAGKASEG